MENGIILETLREDFQSVAADMQAFSLQVMARRISQFPVFIASQDPISIGRPFLNADSRGLAWNFNVSILEDLIHKGLVNHDRKDDFLNAFGNPADRACIFVVYEDQGSFIFLPYALQEDPTDF